MSTDGSTPEVIELDPASNDDALRLAAAIRSVCDIDGRWDAAEILQALATPPALPEEPPAWTLVATSRNNPLRVFYRVEDHPGMRRPWRHVGGGWHTWAEVCDAAREDSGGTPEVLEPEAVKALRGQVETLSGWVKDAEKKRDEARGTVDQVRAEFRKAFTVDFGGWDWRDDDAIQTLARSLSRILSDKPANGDDEPPALEAS